MYQAPPLEGINPRPAKEAFDGLAVNEANFLGKNGVRQAPGFTDGEINRIKELIKGQLLKNAREIVPEAVNDLSNTPLEQYHNIADKYDHKKLLSKLARILDNAAVQEIKKMSFFEYLKDIFGDDYYLSDEENVGHEQICFRIVRPNEPNDVGSLHRDRWFWEHYDWPVPKGWGRAKVWVQICGEAEKCGLMLAPNSHSHPGQFAVEVIDGKVAFVPKFDLNEINLGKYMGKIGEPVLFNYGVLHVGSYNISDVSRVSFEITIMFREREKDCK